MGNASQPIDVSVLVPAYNAGRWLSEAIESVLGQTIGPERFEVVIINDGSTDETARIADTFAAEHPNVSVVHQANAGVATALNVGVSGATGRYITFLGADDRLSPNALASVVKFFDEHREEIDLAAIGIEMFGTRTGPHWNNGKRFVRTRIIDVEDEWNTPHIHGGGTFVKAELLKSDGIAFDPRLFITEDATVNTQVIMRKMRYGVVAGATYHNRRHAVGVSLVSSANFRPEFYTSVPKWSYLHLMEQASERFGYIPRYVQAVVAYDLAWRFRDAQAARLSPTDRQEYHDLVTRLLHLIDDKVLLARSNTIEEKIATLSIKHECDIRADAVRVGSVLYYDGLPLYDYRGKRTRHHRRPACDIEFLELDADRIHIDGVFRAIRFADADFGFRVGDEFLAAEHDERAPLTRLVLGTEVPAGWRFRIVLPLQPGGRLEPVVRLKGSDGDILVPLPIRLHPYTRFSGSARLPYYRQDGRILVRQISQTALVVEKLTAILAIRRELGFLRRARRAGAGLSTLALRVAARALRAFRRRPLWLLGDHKSEAGDNAEALFRYVVGRPRVHRPNVRFWLSKNSVDYPDLKGVGSIVEPDSVRFSLAYLSATWIASSGADDYIVNPLRRRHEFLNDLRPARQAFLQHGITKDDQSDWLNRWRKGFDLFVTSAERERDSILADEYGYRPDQVVLTGMPRYDRLADDPEGVLLIAPTWRRHLVGEFDPSTGRNAPYRDFADSEYFRFWQDLIAHPLLNTELRRLGMRGIFALHPSHAAEVGHFRPTELITVSSYPHDYRYLFKASNVLVTDYSSVAFDFAYLRKPVIYAQGDRDLFFASHLYDEGYYSYEVDGFGPITRTFEETAAKIVETLRGGCAMDEASRDRVDRFFAYNDADNCARLYRAMLERSPVLHRGHRGVAPRATKDVGVLSVR